MKCPFCGSSQISVVNSRPTKQNTQVWRRRICSKCGEVFTTHELIDLTHLIVIKKSGEKEKYSRIKLYSGVYNATVSTSPNERPKLVEEIIQEVERQILELRKKEVESSDVGEIVLNTLKNKSPGAFLGFLTFYKKVSSKSQIRKLIRKYL